VNRSRTLNKENSISKGKVIVIVAPSGTGKSTIARKLLHEFPDIKFSISATTRPPRNDEKEGREYYFLSEEQFEERAGNGEFLEWEYYNGHRYGTLRSEVDKLLESGYFPLLDIEVKGALNIKDIYGDDCVAIFIRPPSIEELEKRLIKRGTESETSMKRRIEIAEEELTYADNFDFVVVNDELDEAYDRVKSIIKHFINH